MKPVHVRVHPSKAGLPREEQLAWKIAAVAADPVAVPDETAEMVVNWVIDNAAVAIASVNRHPRMSARDMASAHPAAPGRAGAAVFGMEANIRVSPEWAAWANGTAVRELDMHDTFLAADYSHPGDNIPPILAVGQHLNLDGQALLRGLAAEYEIHIDLVRAISLHEHKIDHIAHLCLAQAAGIGTGANDPQKMDPHASSGPIRYVYGTRSARSRVRSGPSVIMPRTTTSSPSTAGSPSA